MTLLSPIFCKILSYFLNLCPTLSAYFIVFTSIDRYYSSSIDVHKHQLSNRHRALIGFDTPHDGIPLCHIQSKFLSNRIFLILDLILYVILAPFSMLVFGCLTIYNTKQARSIPVRTSRYRRTESQLSRILFLQIATHIILTIPFCIIFFLMILPISAQYTIICKIPFYLTTTTTFFLYLLSARVYRLELLRLFNRRIPFHRPVRAISSIPMNILQS